MHEEWFGSRGTELERIKRCQNSCERRKRRGRCCWLRVPCAIEPPEESRAWLRSARLRRSRVRAIGQPAVTTVAPAMAAKTHAHAVTTAAAAGRCLHASTSSPPPPPPPPISRLVGKYPHTPRSNQSALACPRGCSHGPGGILSLPLFRFARSYSLFCHSLSRSTPPLSLFLTLLFSVCHCLSLALSFTWLLTRAVRYTSRTGVIPIASRGTGRGHRSRGWG